MGMSLLALHLAFAGIWLGCVLTETLFERALLGKGREPELILVGLHQKVDLFVEIPAFVAVLLTGGLMYSPAALGTVLQVKIALGLVAVAVNLYCVRLVWRRAAAARQGDWQEFSRLDAKQHKYGAIVLLAIIAALALGVAVV